eukprot:scaffold2501_cov174-Amphora_coffeaeformis.AAC.11
MTSPVFSYNTSIAATDPCLVIFGLLLLVGRGSDGYSLSPGQVLHPEYDGIALTVDEPYVPRLGPHYFSYHVLLLSLNRMDTNILRWRGARVARHHIS